MMNITLEFLRKIGRLFVDDDSLAIALLLWCTASGLIFPALAPDSVWSAPLFALGCLSILLGNLVWTIKHNRMH
jgi:hypothetical protein